MTKFTLILFLGLTQLFSAQTLVTSDMKLKIESSSGNNGLAVTYNKKLNLYYSAFAGNASYNIEVHNSLGKTVFTKEIGADIRGFWYNDSKNRLEGIVYGNEGSFFIDLDANGYPTSLTLEEFSYGMDGQSVACYNKGSVYFLNEYGFSKFKEKSSEKKTLKSSGILSYSSINTNSVFHTGKKKMELGAFDYANKKIILCSEKKGSVKKEITLKLPGNFEIPTYFNASYANGHVFLYNKTDITWYGFNIF
jgi:hypothetical protein